MSLPEIIERVARTWRWLWYEIRHPMLDCDGRRLIGLYLLLVGLTRLMFVPIVALDFASDHVYGGSRPLRSEVVCWPPPGESWHLRLSAG